MTIVDAVTYITEALFLAVAIYVAAYTLTARRRSNPFVPAFFALLAIVIAFSLVQKFIELTPADVAAILPLFLVFTLPYVLIRLVQQYSYVNPVHRRLVEIGTLASFALILYPGPDNILVRVLLFAFFGGVSIYSARRFYVGSAEASGITRKRLGALTLASTLLGIPLFLVGLTAFADGLLNDLIEITIQGMLVGSALLFLAGFSPPTLLRRAWQEPEIRQFLHRALKLPRWSSSEDALRYIERATAATLGAPHASIGLWNADHERIDFEKYQLKPGEAIGGQAFASQRPILSLDTIADDPENEAIYELEEAYAAMAAPIRNEGGVNGVIVLHSPNAPVFAEDDLSLLTLLADQIGVLLENRHHMQSQAELAAREESTRLKDEFLSVAAHDLRTPLTTILATGQYLERKLGMNGRDTPEARSVVRLNREARRLRLLIQQLLDTSRIEHGQLLAEFETTDLSQLVNDVVERISSYGTHDIETDIEPGLIGEYDPVRIQQVVENLLENAQKYSPAGTTICVQLCQDGDEFRLSVTDNGAGIDPEHSSSIFERYFRSPEATNGSAQGIGLGLYICREIVEQHGGRIWVESSRGTGSTFHVALRRIGVATSAQ